MKIFGSIVALALIFAPVSAISLSNSTEAYAKEKPTCSDTGGTYVNASGHVVLSPKCSSRHIEGATARCRDGTESFSEHRSGTCSGHHGVAQWYR